MKTFVTLALMAMVVSAVVGCRASAEVDPDTATSVSMPR